MLTVLANGLEPPAVTPPTTACEVSMGTDCPTFMVAGTLSVAMMLGADMTRAFWVTSLVCSTPNNSWLFRTSAPTERPKPPEPAVAFSTRERVPPESLCCRYELTPAENAPLRSTS